MPARAAGHRDVLEPIIAGALAALSTEAAVSRLDQRRHRHGAGRATWRRCGRTRSLPRAAAGRVMGSPAGPLPGAAAGQRRRLGAAPSSPVPALGQHTEAILAEFGLADLRNTKAKP